MQGIKLYINLYDLSPANDFLYQIGVGFHHSGIEFLGSEYSFASNAGIFESSPKEAPGAKFREQIFMGVVDGGEREFKRALDEVKEQFGPNGYNIVRKNCNHFVDALVWKLLGKRSPGYINRAADIGSCCSCLLPKQMLEGAPVGDPDKSGSTASSSFTGIYKSGPSAPQANDMRAFTGTGQTLGGTASSSAESEGLLGTLLGKAGGTSNSTSSNNKGTDDLTDRREKARKAALSRLERQQQTSNEYKDK